MGFVILLFALNLSTLLIVNDDENEKKVKKKTSKTAA